MPRTSSLSKNTKQYLNAFIWLAIAIGIVSVVQLIVNSIPQQSIVIGAYNITQTPVVVTDCVTTYRVTTTIPMGNVLRLSFPRTATTAYIEGVTGMSWSFAIYRDNNRWINVWAPPTPWHVTYTFYYDRHDGWSIFYNNIAPMAGGASGNAGVWYFDPSVTVRPVDVVIVQFQNTIVYYPVITLTETITTVAPVTRMENTVVPIGNAITISNRTFLDLIALGTLVTIMLSAIVKILKMRI